MPELPEVESVRRSLEPVLLHQTVERARVFREDVVNGDRAGAALLAGCRVESLARKGKQLALVGSSGACVCVHLGMTGSLRYAAGATQPAAHVHVVWELAGGGTLAFRDPRRFGGLWTFPSLEALEAARWGPLGPDALAATPAQLHARLSRTRRPLKAALLDQGVVAGLGNIYVDELLFDCGLSPLQPAATLDRRDAARLVRSMRRLLRRAIGAGGSTLRDYVDGNGAAGGFQRLHRVYGRGGLACVRCGGGISTTTLGGRTTAYCPACQPERVEAA